jgi:hypothetical protein
MHIKESECRYKGRKKGEKEVKTNSAKISTYEKNPTKMTAKYMNSY